MINYEKFREIDLRIAKIISAQKIKDSQKLIKIQIDLGGEKRQIVAGIGLKYKAEELVGKLVVVVANLEPRSLMGEESQGMLLAAVDKEKGPILLTTMEEALPGSEVR